MAEAALEETVGARLDVVLRPAISADVPQMIELMRVALGAGSVPRTEVFWRWKHEQNPFGRSPAMVADADGRIVSLRVFLRWRWRYGEQTLAAVRPVDTATHPYWRRRGLFEQLTRELLQVMQAEGVAFVFNTPNDASGRGYQKLGWRIVGRPTIRVRPVSLIRVLSALARQDEPMAPAEAPQPVASASTDILASPDLGAFLRNAERPGGRLVSDVDAAYLAWRYRDCPGLAYGAAGTFDRTSGALVIFRRAMRQGLRELRICDLFCTEAAPSRAKMRQVIRSLLSEQDVDLATARAVPGTGQPTVLLRSGFLPIRRLGPTLAVRPLAADGDLPPIDRLSAWGASIGDLEVF